MRPGFQVAPTYTIPYSYGIQRPIVYMAQPLPASPPTTPKLTLPVTTQPAVSSAPSTDSFGSLYLKHPGRFWGVIGLVFGFIKGGILGGAIYGGILSLLGNFLTHLINPSSQTTTK